jgi:hypothetical protein
MGVVAHIEDSDNLLSYNVVDIHRYGTYIQCVVFNLCGR